ncbi:MAG: nitroreductase family protein [Dehalococcoidia bacterium]|nr:nitroreductase family protein [Dehalococcoidia bacterium]
MNPAITIDKSTCKACGTCGDVCPSHIMYKEKDLKIMNIHEERLKFCVKCGQCMAVCPTASVKVDGLSYEKDFVPLPEGGPFEDAFYKMIMSRRSVRNFKGRPVPRELLEKIADAITYSPPSVPPIKIEITIVQNTEVIRQALPTMIEMYDTMIKGMDNPIIRMFIKKSAGPEKFKVMVSHVVPSMKDRMPELKSGAEDTITRHAPAMIVFHADRNSDNYQIDIDIAITFGILAAHSLGLGATIIELIPPAIEREKKLRKLFCIPDGNEVVASMIVGYPKYRYQRAVRRKLKSVTWV